VGITKKNIRFYEEKGLLSPSRNSENGYRDYGEAEVAALRQIKRMRKLGVPLEEIRRMQAGGTVADGMRRHLVTLERERRNLDEAARLCTLLKEREIPTPGTITFQRTGQTSRYFPDDPCRWNPATVLSILGQDAYLGRTTNFKTTKLSYKSKKTVINSPDKWAVFEGTHEAIIDKETWEIVRRINGRYLRTPMKRLSTRRHGRSYRKTGNTAAVPPRWEKWGCSPGWPIVPTAARSCTTTAVSR